MAGVLLAVLLALATFHKHAAGAAAAAASTSRAESTFRRSLRSESFVVEDIHTVEGKSGAAARETVRLQGAGSSFAAVLHQDAALAYTTVTETDPHLPHRVELEYTSLSSSRGRCRLQDWATECEAGDDSEPRNGLSMAGSDSPYSLEDHEKYPTHQVFPAAASAVAVAYNLPGELNVPRRVTLDVATISRIFTGEITRWRDPTLLDLNPDIADLLPDEDITVVVRNENSGTTAIFKKPLVAHASVFADQEAAGQLESGGNEGFPHSNGTFLMRTGNSDMAYAVLSRPYSIGYVVFTEALQLDLQIFSVLEDNVLLDLDFQLIQDTVERVVLSDDFHGFTEEEVASLNTKSSLAASMYRSKDSYTWPFIGFTYIIVQDTFPDDAALTCLQIAEMAHYLEWFYSSDLVYEVAKHHMKAIMSQPVRDVILKRLGQMTCDGAILVDHDRYSKSHMLEFITRGTMSRGLSGLVPLPAMQYRTQQPEFRAEVTVNDNVGADAPFDETESFRVLAVPFGAKFPSDVVVMPWFMSGVMVHANLPGLDHFVFSLETLASILNGNITRWNDPFLVELNPSLAAVDEPLAVWSSTAVSVILDVALAEFGGFKASATTVENVQAAVARLREQEYTMVVAAGYEDGLEYGAVGRVLTASSGPGGVEPSQDSFNACRLSSTSGKPVDTSLEGCYPLVFPVYLVLRQQYPTGRDQIADGTVRFWWWMLNDQAVSNVHWSMLPIFSLVSDAQKTALQSRILSITYSDGTPILRLANQPSSHLMSIILGVSVTLSLLLLVLLLVTFLYMQSRRKLKRIHNIEKELDLDTESPIIKVMKFLQGLETGKKLNRAAAGDLLVMLRNTDNLQAPDIKAQVKELKQNSSTRDLVDSGIGNYLVGLTQGNHHVPRSASSQSLFDGTFPSRASMDFLQSTPTMMALRKATTQEAIQAFFTSVLLPEQTSFEELENLLQPLLDNFFCNITHLEDITSKPLSVVLIFLLYEGGIIQRLKLNVEKLFCFALEIEEKYDLSNPYHNQIHAAFVVHRTFVGMQKLNLTQDITHVSWMLAALIGAAVHDVDHPGVNNAHVVKTEDTLARKFNDQAVLENESLQIALNLLRAEETNFLLGSHLEHAKRWREFKSNLITVVLATDMSRHFQIVSTFQQKVASLGEVSEGMAYGGTDEQLGITVQMVVKMADIGHCTAHRAQHYYWSQCLQDEFFAQGDQEKIAGFEVSALMDRDKPGVMYPKNQIGFFKVILLPLHEAFTQVFPAMRPVQELGQQNLQHWQDQDARPEPPETETVHHYKKAMVVQFQNDRTLLDYVAPHVDETSFSRVMGLRTRLSMVARVSSSLMTLNGDRGALSPTLNGERGPKSLFSAGRSDSDSPLRLFSGSS